MAKTKLIRNKHIIKATRYEKAGDWPYQHIWTVATPVLDELLGKPWPDSGRLGTLAECNPNDLRYAIYATAERKKHFDIQLGWWILEIDGEVVAVKSHEQMSKNFEDAE